MYFISTPWYQIRSNFKDDVAAMGGLGASLLQPKGAPKSAAAPKAKKIPPMSRQLASKITAVSQRLSELVAWESKLDSAKLNLWLLFQSCIDIIILYIYV